MSKSATTIIMFCAAFGAAVTAAAVPLAWRVETSRLEPVTFDAVHGERLELEASFESYGRPLEMALKPCGIFWQTNGMGNAWWTGPATAVSNRVSAVFTPAMDAGGAVVHGFLGSTGDIYRAAFTLRFRPGPGARPNVIALPTPYLDFATVELRHVEASPFATLTMLASATNATLAAAATNAFGVIVAATNATLAAANRYTDSAIISAGAVTADQVTNTAVHIATHATSNIVTKSFVEGLGIASEEIDPTVGITNGTIYVKGKEITPLTEYEETDPTVPDWAKAGTKPEYTADEVGAVDLDGATDIALTIAEGEINDWANDVGSQFKGVAYQLEPNAPVEWTQIVNHPNFYPEASGNALAGQLSAIGSHLNAEDARFVSTNYNSETRIPEAYVEVKTATNTWLTIWREMTRWNWMVDNYLPTNYYNKAEVDAQFAEKADRAWGLYDSHSGGWAPDGFTWVSSPKIAIAAGLAYQRNVTAEGAIWVLESNGLVTETGGATNGFFRVSDDEGNAMFEIVKGNKRTVGADADGCQVLTAYSPQALQVHYSITSDVPPKASVCLDIANPAWKDEDAADCQATVSWSGASGNWTAVVQPKTPTSKLFVRASYQVGGETYVRNTAPVSMSYLILNDVKYSVGTAVISGHTVLTLTPAN